MEEPRPEANAALDAVVEQRTAELKRALTELERLARVTRKMISTLDLDEVLDVLIRELEEMFAFEGIAILLLTEDRARLQTRKLRIPGMPPERIRRIIEENEAIPVERGVGGGVAAAVLTAKDYYFNDIDPQALPDGPNKEAVVRTGLRSVLIMPLLVGDEPIGVMMMSGYDRTLDFGPQDLATIRRFVGQISQAVKNSQVHEALQQTTERLNRRTAQLAEANRKLEEQNAKLEEQKRLLEELSATDPLTSVRNRRFFFDRAAEELERSRRYGRAMSVLMLDVDNFKELNDSRGHDCGDAALRDVASIVQGLIRQTDLLARYGGEEFVVALSNSGPDGAARLGERIRKAIESHPFRHAELEARLTVSIGFSCFPSPHGPQATIDQLVKEADEALYSAKARGKNRCVYRHQPAS